MGDRNERGQFTSGNTAALIHGGRSRQVHAGTLAVQAEALAAMAEERAQIESDLGGASELSQLQRDLITSYLRLGLIETFAFQNIESGGVFTTTGKQRAVVQTLMKAIAQRSELAKTLGLARRAKGVPQSIADIVASVKGS